MLEAPLYTGQPLVCAEPRSNSATSATRQNAEVWRAQRLHPPIGTAAVPLPMVPDAILATTGIWVYDQPTA